MSVRSINDSQLIKKAIGDTDDIWERPTDWLVMPDIGSNDQKCAMLIAILDCDSNYAAFTSSGNYTVDWGDGVVENIATGVKAEHNYIWSNVNSNTLTSDGFRQAMVIVTPQSGQTLSTINFQQRHTDLTVTNNNTRWLDIKIGITGALTLSNYTTNITNFPDLRILTIENHQTTLSSSWLRGNAFNVTQVFINKPNLNIFSSGPFQYSTSLEYVYLHPTTTANSDCSNLFNSCRNLRKAPFFNTSSTTNMTNMFAYCDKLTEVPLYNTSNVTVMESMFSNCFSLETIPLFDMTKVTNCQYMFSVCYALKSIPYFNIGGTNCNSSYMFANCKRLTKVNLNVKTIATPTSMFESCTSLTEVGALEFDTCGSFTSTFSSCSNLRTIPNIFTRSGGISNQFSSVFANCNTLMEIPKPNLVSGQSNFNPGSNLFNLKEWPAIDLRWATSAISVNSARVHRSKLYGAKISHSYQNNMLGKTSIDEVISNLGIAATTQTLTITGNPGANKWPIISRSSTTTTGSTTITIADTSNFVTGMQVTGTGISDARSVTFDDATDTVTLAGHGIANDKLVSFTVITTTTGIVIYTPYYVVNATTDTFQLSTTQGGSPIALTNNGSGSMIYQTLVTAIDPNVSVTIDIPASTSATNTLAYRNLNTQIAVMKRWSVTG